VRSAAADLVLASQRSRALFESGRCEPRKRTVSHVSRLPTTRLWKVMSGFPSNHPVYRAWLRGPRGHRSSLAIRPFVKTRSASNYCATIRMYRIPAEQCSSRGIERLPSKRGGEPNLSNLAGGETTIGQARATTNCRLALLFSIL
jgi:hypothetical protein